MCLSLLPDHTHPITTLSREGMGARALAGGGWGGGGLLVSVTKLCLSYPIWMPPLPPISLPCSLCRWSPTLRRCPSC